MVIWIFGILNVELELALFEVVEVVLDLDEVVAILLHELEFVVRCISAILENISVTVATWLANHHRAQVVLGLVTIQHIQNDIRFEVGEIKLSVVCEP